MGFLHSTNILLTQIQGSKVRALVCLLWPVDNFVSRLPDVLFSGVAMSDKEDRRNVLEGV